ncbi:MAG: ABC transporter substrate-binding protein [Odoribacteraceae bacterium]|jgi:LysM repeat protein|nr:ABC transporter substrate-binding protein [Odoribacteraceae bacterium]
MGLFFGFRLPASRGGLARHSLAMVVGGLARGFLLLVLVLGCRLAAGQEGGVERSGHVVVVDGREFYSHRVEAGQTLFSIARAYGVSVEDVLVVNGKRDFSLSLDEVLLVPLPGVAGMAPRASGHVKVSVLLPFGAGESSFPSPGEAGAPVDGERWRLSTRSEPFLEFYAGLLLAMDSLKHEGYAIDLQVFDTRGEDGRLDFVAEEVNVFDPDVVIGPVYAGDYARVVERLERRDVPVVYPLSVRTEGLGRFPNFVQVTGSTSALLDEMARWTADRGRRGHVLAIVPPFGTPRGEESDLHERVRGYLQAGDTCMTVFHWDGGSLAPLRELMRAGGENVVLFPTLDEALASRLLPGLAAWAERFHVTVVGFPEWLKFTAIDEEMLFKLNMVLFQPSFARRDDPRVEGFSSRYRLLFHAEPSLMAFKAFDIGLFFIRHAAANGFRSLESLAGEDSTGEFTRFKFAPLPGMPGLENRGFFLINYTPAYEIRVNALY